MTNTEGIWIQGCVGGCLHNGGGDCPLNSRASIVRAVNAHEALVVAAQQALELLIGASSLTASDVRTALRVALALAEQEVSA